MTTYKNDIVCIKKGRSLRLVKEVTAGTLVLPTTYWRGAYTAKSLDKIEMRDEDVSILTPLLDSAYIPKTGTEITLAPTPATFEQLPILLDSGVKTVTPAADGGGSGYVSTYAFHHSPTSPNAITSRSVEFNDNQEADRAAYMFTREFTLSGAQEKPVMMSAVCEARGASPNVYTASLAFVNATKKITDAASGLAIFPTGATIRVSGTANNDGVYTVATGGVAGEIVTSESLVNESAVSCTVEQIFTAGATIPTVEEIMFGTGKLYMGSVGTAMGSLAQITNTWLGFTFKATGGQGALFSGDGSTSFSTLTPKAPAITLDLTFLYNGKATAERRLAVLRTPRKFRMKWEGSALTAGTSYSKKTLLVDGCGLWNTFESLDEIDGNDVIKATMTVGYNATASLFCAITVVNSLAAVL